MGDHAKSRSAIAVPGEHSSHSKATMGERSFSKMRMRRQSYGFGKVPGITQAGPRTSQLGMEFKRPPLVYLPTYQLDPLRPVKNAEVLAAIEASLDENFSDHKYNVQESPALALKLAGEIMRKMKTFEYNRYRYIAIVTIGQKRAQSYNNAITFLWDHERDSYVDAQRESSTVFIQVTAFAIYLD